MTPLVLGLAGAAAIAGLGESLAGDRADARRSSAMIVGGALLVGTAAFGYGLGLPDRRYVLIPLLLTALAGTLLLVADLLCPRASAAAPMLSQRLLMMSAALGVIATGLLLQEDQARVTAGLACGTGLLVLCLFVFLDVDRLTALAAALSVVLLLLTGWEAWREQGSYLAADAPQAVVVALAGIAAVQPAGGRVARLVLLVAALVGAAVA